MFCDSEWVWAFTNTQMLWEKKCVNNWHLYSSKYFSMELNSEEVAVLPCGSECRGGTGVPSELGSVSLQPRGTGVICNWINSGFVQGKGVRGEERKQQAYIKSSSGSQPLPTGDKEKWISCSGTSSASSSQITPAPCLVKAQPCSECLVSVPCPFSSAKLICWGSAKVPARGASLSLFTQKHHDSVF